MSKPSLKRVVGLGLLVLGVTVLLGGCLVEFADEQAVANTFDYIRLRFDHLNRVVICMSLIVVGVILMQRTKP